MKLHSKTFIAAFVFCSLIIAGPCCAHKVRIFAWSEGNIIHTESKFSGGKSAQNSTITVIDSSTGAELLHGKTDKNGLFEFPVPNTASEELDIVINSGDGHKNHWLYQLNPTATLTKVTPKQNLSTDKVITETSPSVHLTQEQLTDLINNLLEGKFAPIRRQLAQQQEQGPSLQDILGAIGYIIGLAGIAAYMKSKKE